jgi:hypothetical protein
MNDAAGANKHRHSSGDANVPGLCNPAALLLQTLFHCSINQALFACKHATNNTPKQVFCAMPIDNDVLSLVLDQVSLKERSAWSAAALDERLQVPLGCAGSCSARAITAT